MNSWLENMLGQYEPGTIPLEIFALLLVLGLLIFLWDFFDRKYSNLADQSDSILTLEVLSLKDNDKFPTRSFQSINLMLKGTPDALVKEGKFTIPVDLVPMSSKVQDRHVVKILSYLRLIEEETNTRPPHGILLMGKKRRVVKVKNTEEKQRWLETLIDEMHSINEGIPAVPRPTEKKCKFCDVSNLCEHRHKS